MRGVVLLLAISACRIGFDPVDTEQQVGAVDAASGDGVGSPSDVGPMVACQMRVANTDNAYIPIAQCTSELDAARTQCNADAACVLTGWYWGPGTGINDTGACADGGDGMSGCRQWTCSTRGQVPSDHVAI